MLRHRDFRKFPISDISGGLFRKKGDVRVRIMYRGAGGMIPQKTVKSRSSEMQFPTFWTSNRVAFMKIFIAIWQLFSVKNRV